LKEILSNHTAPQATLLVVEAGDLPQRHGLVQVFEQAPTAFAARCFHDAGQDLRPLIEETLRQSGYEATAEAMAFLAQHLGDDRGVTRSELGKLCLYIGDKKKRIEIEDVVACIGDQAAIQLDDLLMAIADGDLQGVEKIYDRCVVDSEPVALLRAASRHFARLHLIAGRMKEGESFERVAASLRPPLFWAIRSKVEKQCRSWDVASIAWAINRLIDAEATTMKHYPIASTVARHALVDIAARRPKSGSVVRSISRG